jgi:hypothetical protein
MDMSDIPVSLIIAALSALVGLLCFGLWIAALLRIGKARTAGGAFKGETSADLRVYARNQLLSAIVMFALAAIIIAFS